MEEIEMEDYVDITPKMIDPNPDKKGQGTVFQETEWRQIRENPGRLTREGVEEKLRVWTRSQNHHVRIKYQTMLAQCEKFAPSGKTKDGRVVYSRSSKGVPNWTEAKHKPIVEENEEVKPKSKIKKD
jgi:hypothetical protein